MSLAMHINAPAILIRLRSSRCANLARCLSHFLPVNPHSVVSWDTAFYLPLFPAIQCLPCFSKSWGQGWVSGYVEILYVCACNILIIVCLYFTVHNYLDWSYVWSSMRSLPRRKGMHLRTVNWWKYAVFAWKSLRVTARYRPKPFISGLIDDEVNMELLWFCTRSNLRQVGCNIPNSCPLQTQCAVKTPSPFIFGLLVTVHSCTLVRAWAWPATNFAVNRM